MAVARIGASIEQVIDDLSLVADHGPAQRVMTVDRILVIEQGPALDVAGKIGHGRVARKPNQIRDFRQSVVVESRRVAQRERGELPHRDAIPAALCPAACT